MSKPAIWSGIKGSLVAILLSTAAATSSASASTLHYFKGATKASNETMCLSFALDQAKRTGLQNVRHSNVGIDGSKGNLFAALTCVGNEVIVMVSGDNGTDPRPLAKELFDGVRGEQTFD